MNVLVVDTSSWISYFKGQEMADVDLALKEGRVYLPPVVLAELLSGKMKNDDRARLIDFLKELPLCDHSFEHWIKVGELRSALAFKGITISTPDAHVAQCAIDLQGYLVTEDQLFAKAAPRIGLKLL